MPSVAEEPREGQLVGGRYRLIQPLGAGGMGSVWRATHLGLGVIVAVKFLSQALAGHAEAHARFAREASTAAMVRGRHVVDVLDFGVDELGRPFLAMELLSGEDLANRVVRLGRLPPEQVVEIIEQASRGLAKAHASGVVHRDLKPANLFLTARADGTPLIKVLDFGISKTLDEGATPLTTTHGAMGSPMYMSPEQIRSAKRVDARTDIWSLGVILYELLADATPFEADTTSAMLAAIVADPPIPLRSRRADVPAALEQVIARCLEKDPTRRFASLAELSAALAPFAPEQARVSVPRIARVLGAAGPPQTEAAPPRSLAATMGETRGRPPETADTAPAVSSPTTAKQDGAPPDAWVPSFTGTPVGTPAATPAGTQAPARSARGVLIAVAATGLVGLAATTLVVGRTRSTDASGASGPASGATTAAPSEPARPALPASSSPAAPSASTAPAASTTTTADGRSPPPVGAERAPSRGKAPPATPSVSAPIAAPPSPASPTQAPTRAAVPEERTW